MDDDEGTVVGAGNQINVFSTGNLIQAGQVHGTALYQSRDERADKDELAKSRESFLFDFYRQALKQAETTFRMSVVFMSIGTVIVLAGGVLALVRFGNVGRDNIALLTALSGVIIGSCGGAFAVHANRARKHLTTQAEKMEQDLQADRKLEQTLRLIDEVEDADLRDRLKSVAAMRVLDVGPDPENVTHHLLARDQQRERVTAREDSTKND
jgi:hypothetical protein